jgi:glycosyltransferase involved in cell wall biosynthesis
MNKPEQLKKVLILGYFFPPSSMPASLRLWGFAKYFHKFGYYPVIVSRKWENHGGMIYDSFIQTKKNIDYIKTSEYEAYLLPYSPSLRDRFFVKYPKHKFYSIIRKILTFSDDLFAGLSNNFNSYKNVYRFSEELIANKNGDYHAIIASGNPFLLFKFARKLSLKYKVPYILDYRDDWNTNELNKPQNLLQRIAFYYTSWLEKKWTKNALFFSTVTEKYKERIEKFIGVEGVVVMNGFFELPKQRIINRTDNRLNFLYSGTLYKVQDVEFFLSAFSSFIKKHGNVARVLFAGVGFDEEQKKMLNKFEITDSVFVLPRVSSEEIHKLYEQTDVFLQFAYADYKGILPVKIFEYISYEKPILFCKSDYDLMNKLLIETRTGIIVENYEETYNYLVKAYNQFVNKKGLDLDPDREQIKKYSRENQVKIFAVAMDDLL